MIKINLLAERKTLKARPVSGVSLEGAGRAQNLLLAGILVLGIAVSIGWWWLRDRELRHWKAENAKADVELSRLVEIRKKGELYKRQKELLEQKIRLITDLKKKQTVPVYILDQISRNVPDFLWLDAMDANGNQIQISGKATTYTAVSNFYDNLQASGYFTGVDLGKTAEVSEGVSFSLLCRFTPAAGPAHHEPQG